MGAVAALDLAQVVAARREPGDFVQDYLSAGLLAAGRPVYEPTVPDRSRMPVFDPGEPVVNDHPPTYILALAPLGALPYPTAFIVLGGLSVAAGGWAGWRVGREVGLPPAGRAAVAAAVLAHPGTAIGLQFGSISLPLFAGLVATWSAWRSGRYAAAGAWVGLAAAVKLFPGFVGFGLLAGRRWRGVATAAVVVVAVWCTTAAVVGPGQLEHYLRERMPANAARWSGCGVNLSLTGIVHRTFGQPSPASPWLVPPLPDPALARALSIAAQLVVLAAVAVRLSGPLSRQPDQAFALLVPAMLLLSPLTWLHALPMLAAPLAILAHDATGRRAWALIACGLAVSLNDLWLARQLVQAGWVPVPWWGNLLLLLPAWGLVGVFALAATAPPRR